MRTSGQIARAFYEHQERTETLLALIRADQSLNDDERANRLNCVQATSVARNLQLQVAYRCAIETQAARVPSRPLITSRHARGRFGRRRSVRSFPY